MSQHTPTILLILALLLIPLFIWLEHADLELWNQRLIIPTFEEEPNRHTPLHALGTFLPPIITENRTLTAADNPVIITNEILVPRDVTLTLNSGVKLFAHEFAALRVAGSLVIHGEAKTPVQFTTNEVHPLNQVWGGIIFEPGSRGNLTSATFTHASPALTCLPQSTLTAQHVEISQGSLGFFTQSEACRLIDSVIHGVRDGVTALGVTPQLSNTRVSGREHDIQTFNSP